MLFKNLQFFQIAPWSTLLSCKKYICTPKASGQRVIILPQNVSKPAVSERLFLRTAQNTPWQCPAIHPAVLLDYTPESNLMHPRLLHTWTYSITPVFSLHFRYHGYRISVESYNSCIPLEYSFCLFFVTFTILIILGSDRLPLQFHFICSLSFPETFFAPHFPY